MHFYIPNCSFKNYNFEIDLDKIITDQKYKISVLSDKKHYMVKIYLFNINNWHLTLYKSV